MCGLFGVYYKKADSKRLPKDAIALAAYLTQLRGIHGLGMMTTYQEKGTLWLQHVKQGWEENEHGKVTRIGEYETPHEKIQGKFFSKALEQQGLRSIAIHTRHATRGVKNSENTHPFKHEGITLMHNGTLIQDFDINNKYFDVDSKALCHFLGEGGSVSELIAKTRGAYALVWQDQAGGFLNLLRNTERPLILAESDDMLMWASTPAVIGALSTQYGLGLRNLQELKPHLHLRIEIESGKVTQTQHDAPVFVQERSRWFNYGGTADEYDIYADTKKPALPATNVATFTSSSLSGLEPNSPAWFAKLFKINKGSSKNSTIYNVGNSLIIPTIQQRIMFGAKTLDDNQVWRGLTYGLNSVNVGSSIILSIYNFRANSLISYDYNKKMVTCHARVPVVNGVDEEFDDIVVTVSEDVYREALYNRVLVRGQVSNIFKNAAGNQMSVAGVAAIMCFDPSINGQLVKESNKSINDDTMKQTKEMIENGTC